MRKIKEKAKTHAFDKGAQTYDNWFEVNKAYYQSELQAIKRLLPRTGKGIEVGVGTGRFAEPLGIRIGIEPSAAMSEIAIKRGINVIAGVAEKLPIETGTYDYVIFVTTLCFLNSLDQAISEAYRILKSHGTIIIAFIEKESFMGQNYQQAKETSQFYRDAVFLTAREIIEVLRSTGFADFRFTQTVFSGNGEEKDIQAVKEGHDSGSFVVIRGNKTI